jgi:hypothetical protein
MSSQTKQDMTSEVIISDKVDSLHKVGGSPFHKNQHEKTCCPVARARWRVLGGVRVLQSKFKEGGSGPSGKSRKHTSLFV